MHVRIEGSGPAFGTMGLLTLGLAAYQFSSLLFRMCPHASTAHGAPSCGRVMRCKVLQRQRLFKLPWRTYVSAGNRANITSLSVVVRD